MLEIGINSEILNQIRDGKKTVEGRLAKGKFLTIKPGDVISIREDIYQDDLIVSSYSDAARIQVSEIDQYESFKLMLESKGFDKAIPDARSLEDACSEYARYYSRDDERQYGVLAITFTK